MWRRDVGWAVLVFLVVVGALLATNSHWSNFSWPDSLIQRAEGPDYSHVPTSWTGRAACLECHAPADSTWTGSDHDLAMQIPGPETITANFNNSTFTHFGVTSTFFRSGEKYMVRTDGPDGSLTDFEIAFVFGYYPLEQFLIRFPDGRLQALNVCWDTHTVEEGGQRWFHLYPHDETPATDLFHWTGMLQNWNFMCAECHSTNLQRNYNPVQNTYATTWSEIDVSCEACHGPGSRHITWERAYARGLRPKDVAGTRGLVVDLKSTDHGEWIFEKDKTTASRTMPWVSRVEVESCARCHSRRSKLNPEYEYGRPFSDDFRLNLLTENLYYADGQNQDEVYVYGSFLQSKMYAAGVTCSDCHDYHSTRTLGQGNQVCAKCHQAQVFDTPEHHFHKIGQGGDSCLDCHMQARKLMVVDGRRDHSFRIPRPDLSLELGTPNACNDCHEDKSAQWSQDAIVQWYGDDRLQGPHYAVALQAGRLGSPGALDRLRFLLRSADQPDIAKATALSLIPKFAQGAEVPEVIQALENSNPLVRAAAVRALASSSPDLQMILSLPMVRDEILDVRVAAAGVVANSVYSVSNPVLAKEVAHAQQIWRDHHNANLDRPESLIQLAALSILNEQNDQAEKYFQAALKLEAKFGPTYVNFADFLRRQGRLQEASDLLDEGILKVTFPADLHHALGLLLVARKNLPDALVHLEIAASQNEDLARYAYVFAVALYDSGQIEKSLMVLENSLLRHPWDWDNLQALALYSLQQHQPERALNSLQSLLELAPANEGVRRLLVQANEQIKKN